MKPKHCDNCAARMNRKQKVEHSANGQITNIEPAYYECPNCGRLYDEDGLCIYLPEWADIDTE